MPLRSRSLHPLPQCRTTHGPAEGAPSLAAGVRLLSYASERQRGSCGEESLLTYRFVPFALWIPIARQPRIALAKSSARSFLLNCSGVTALHRKKIHPSRDEFAQWPQVLMREQSTSEQNRKTPTCHNVPQNCSIWGSEDAQIRWISPPPPCSTFSRMWVCPKKESHPWGTSSCFRCITVSQQNVFLQHHPPDLPEHQCPSLHAPKHLGIMHAVEIRGLEHSSRGGHSINMINMQTFGCLFK